MRGPRNRRLARSKRPHAKEHYVAMATRIQRCFREFCGGRYRKLCLNYNDNDFISMNPVGLIPRHLLFVTDNRGFDARELFTWMLKTNIDPISRVAFSPRQRQACAQQLRRFVSASRATQPGKVGFFSRYRSLLRKLAEYAKHAENG